MLTNQRLAEVMTTAADSIAALGLAKHVLVKKSGPTEGAMCVRGAIQNALGLPATNASFHHPDVRAAEEALWPLLAAELPDGFHYVHEPSDERGAFGSLFWERDSGTRKVTESNSLALWNNSANRTQDEVVAFLRRASEVFAARHAEGEIEVRVPERRSYSLNDWRVASTSSDSITGYTWTSGQPFRYSSSATTFSTPSTLTGVWSYAD